MTRKPKGTFVCLQVRELLRSVLQCRERIHTQARCRRSNQREHRGKSKAKPCRRSRSTRVWPMEGHWGLTTDPLATTLPNGESSRRTSAGLSAESRQTSPTMQPRPPSTQVTYTCTQHRAPRIASTTQARCKPISAGNQKAKTSRASGGKLLRKGRRKPRRNRSLCPTCCRVEGVPQKGKDASRCSSTPSKTSGGSASRHHKGTQARLANK